MDFNLAAEQEIFQKRVKEFVDREIAPIDDRIESEAIIPPDLLVKIGKQGLLGIPVENKYGGVGRKYVDIILAVEQIAYVNGAVAFHVIDNYLPIFAIQIAGTEEQKAEYLPGLVKGEKPGAFAFTEPDTGSNPREINSTARLDGNYYICNGQKKYIFNASQEGTIVIFLRTGEGTDVSAFIGTKRTSGYTTSEIYSLLGMRGMVTSDIFMKDWKIRASCMLGQRSSGYNILLNTIAIGKLDVAAVMLGIAQRALDESVRHANEKMSRGKPISNYQMIQHQLAEMDVQVVAGRYLLYRAMSLVDEKKYTVGSSAQAKLFLAQVADNVTQRAMQIHGSGGYTKESRIERLYRDAKFGGIVEGTNELQRVMISGEITGK